MKKLILVLSIGSLSLFGSNNIVVSDGAIKNKLKVKIFPSNDFEDVVEKEISKINFKYNDHIKYIDFPLISKAMKSIESNNKKSVINRAGFIGYYQVGLAVLEDFGYVKKGEYKRMLKMKIGQKAFILKYARWSRGMSLKKFLNSHQEELFIKLCKRNYREFKKAGFITTDSDINYVRGLIFASHLVGLTAIQNLLSGKSGKYTDGNNVSALSYFQLGFSLENLENKVN